MSGGLESAAAGECWPMKPLQRNNVAGLKEELAAAKAEIERRKRAAYPLCVEVSRLRQALQEARHKTVEAVIAKCKLTDEEAGMFASLWTCSEQQRTEIDILFRKQSHLIEQLADAKAEIERLKKKGGDI